MTRFVVERFGGKDMKHDPRILADNKAQVASNCELERGNLHGLAGDPVTVGGAVGSTAVSLFYYKREQWIGYSEHTDAVHVPVANDQWNRAVITRDGDYPKTYTEGASYRCGIPAPDAAPSVVPTQPAPPTSDPDYNVLEVETLSYVYTLVDAFGAEGPPSAPSIPVDRVVDTDVNIILGSPPSGDYNFGPGSLKRVYRSSTGSSTAHFLFVAEGPIATNSYTDNVKTTSLAEILPSETWVGPPDDDSNLYPDGPMVGVCNMANGVLAGFAHKTVCFCEPFLPHAWPHEYRITLDEPIVNICAIAAGLLVVTTEKPYLISGVHPASMALTQIDESQGLSSRRGLVDMGSYAIYPSADGLVLVEGATANVVTSQIITYEDWKNYQPETIEGYHEEGKYIGFYGGSSGFVFDPRGGDNAFIDHDRYYKAGQHDGPSGKLLLNSGGNLVSWGDATDLGSVDTYTWHSKKFVAPKQMSFSTARIQAWESLATYPVTMKVYADGVLTDTIVFDEDIFEYKRMSAGFRAKVWEFELTGINPVTYAGLFESMDEVI